MKTKSPLCCVRWARTRGVELAYWLLECSGSLVQRHYAINRVDDEVFGILRVSQKFLRQSLSDGVHPAIVNLFLTNGAQIPDPDKLVKNCIDNTGDLRFLLDFLKQHFLSVYESLRSNNYFMEYVLTSRFEDDDEYSNLIGYVTVLLEYEFGLKWEKSPHLVNCANTDILELLIKGGADPLECCPNENMNGIESIVRYNFPYLLEMALDVIPKEKLQKYDFDDYCFATAMKNSVSYEDSCVQVLLDHGFTPLND